MVEIIWDYYLKWKPIIIKDLNNLHIDIFHNKIPKKDCDGKNQFGNAAEFKKIINSFEDDLKELKESNLAWLYKFRFEKIYSSRNIETIKVIYQKICEKIDQKKQSVLQFLENNDDWFFLEARTKDWTKICRVFCLFNLSRKNHHKIYPLFIDVNHLCCCNDNNKIRKIEKWLESSDKFFDK